MLTFRTISACRIQSTEKDRLGIFLPNISNFYSSSLDLIDHGRPTRRVLLYQHARKILDDVSLKAFTRTLSNLPFSQQVYYVVGYSTFLLISMVRMRLANKNLLFPEYRNRGILYIRVIRFYIYLCNLRVIVRVKTSNQKGASGSDSSTSVRGSKKLTRPNDQSYFSASVS